MQERCSNGPQVQAWSTYDPASEVGTRHEQSQEAMLLRAKEHLHLLRQGLSGPRQ